MYTCIFIFRHTYIYACIKRIVLQSSRRKKLLSISAPASRLQV